MAKVKSKLTAKEVKHAKPSADGKEKLEKDSKRLYIRARVGHANEWLFIYSWEGERIKMRLKGSITEIRALASQYNVMLDVGIKDNHGAFIKTSPKHFQLENERLKELEKRKQQAELDRLENRWSVSKLFEQWHKLDISKRKDGGKEIRRMFEKDVLPHIGNMIVEDVRKADIMLVIDAIQSRGVTRMAKLIFSLIRQMFRYAQDRGVIENDPTSSIRKKNIGGKDVVRDRFLSDDEIKELAKKIPDAHLLHTTECAIWIMLSTCCRVGELCKAQWKDLKLTESEWIIPAENSKNGKLHTIYLSAFAKKQFERLLTLKQSDTWIYPNASNSDHVCEKSITKQIGDRQLTDNRQPMSGRSKHSHSLRLAKGKWTSHDLRRTGATIMGALNVRPDVIEKCLNHTEQDKVKKTYQHQTQIPEQKKAWQKLGAKLNAITSK